MNVKLIIYEAFHKFLSLPGGQGGGSDPKVIKITRRCQRISSFLINVIKKKHFHFKTSEIADMA